MLDGREEERERDDNVFQEKKWQKYVNMFKYLQRHLYNYSRLSCVHYYPYIFAIESSFLKSITDYGKDMRGDNKIETCKVIMFIMPWEWSSLKYLNIKFKVSKEALSS